MPDPTVDEIIAREAARRARREGKARRAFRRHRNATLHLCRTLANTMGHPAAAGDINGLIHPNDTSLTAGELTEAESLEIEDQHDPDDALLASSLNAHETIRDTAIDDCAAIAQTRGLPALRQAFLDLKHGR